jgi:hypothetical protein
MFVREIFPGSEWNGIIMTVIVTYAKQSGDSCAIDLDHCGSLSCNGDCYSFLYHSKQTLFHIPILWNKVDLREWKY